MRCMVSKYCYMQICINFKDLLIYYVTNFVPGYASVIGFVDLIYKMVDFSFHYAHVAHSIIKPCIYTFNILRNCFDAIYSIEHNKQKKTEKYIKIY